MKIDIYAAPLSLTDLEKERASFNSLVSGVFTFGLVSAGIFAMTEGTLQLLGFVSCLLSLFAAAFIAQDSFRRIDFISENDRTRVARWAEQSAPVKRYVDQVASMNRALVYAEFVELRRVVKGERVIDARKPLYCNY